MTAAYSYGAARLRKRNHLPHLDVDGGIYFVTYGLHGALSPAFLARQNRLRAALRKESTGSDGTLAISDERAIDRRLIREAFAEMDRGRGTRLLTEPRAAEVVVENLRHHDRGRYRLYAYCVMPNHVHVAFRAASGFPWWKTVGCWKSYSAKRINQILGRDGPVWQHDNFDRLIRNPRHLERVVNYIAANPAKAGLENWPWVAVLIGPPYLME